MPDEFKSILDEEEIKTLIIALAESRGDDGFTEEEASVALAWAEETEIAYALLQNVLRGNIAIDVKNNECVFSITDSGREVVEQDIALHSHPQSDLIQ